LEHRRVSQAKVTLQAGEAIAKAEIWLAECTTTAAGIEHKISALELERDQLIANMVPPDKRRQHTNEAGMAALELLLQNATGVVDIGIIQSLRDQISSIAHQVHQTQAPTTLPPADMGPPALPHCHLLGGPSERPKGNSTEWSNTKTDLSAILQNAAQSRQQACASAALAAKALHEAITLHEESPTQEGLGEAVQQATKLAEGTEAAAKISREAEQKAAGDLQAHKSTNFATPYDH
jgi:hypothetical protein